MKRLFVIPAFIGTMFAENAVVVEKAENPQKAQTEEKVEKLKNVIVTAGRTEVDSANVARSVTVITAKQIEENGAKNIYDILALVPGVNFRRDGLHTASSSISIRGLPGYYTQVLIDGVAIKDLASPQATPSLFGVNIQEIERVEVLRGAASTLYGSSAVGGVINIITKKAKDKKFGGSFSTEFGTKKYQNQNLNVNGKINFFDYNFNLNWQEDAGHSATKALSSNDVYRNLATGGEVGLNFSDKLRLSFFGRYSSAQMEYDELPFPPFSPGNENAQTQIRNYLYGTTFAGNDLFNKFYDFKLTLSKTEVKRHETEAALADFNSSSVELDWQNTLKFNKENRLVFGYTGINETAMTKSVWNPQTKNDYTRHAVFANYEFEPIKNLFFTAGVRRNLHSDFDNKTTYSASLLYNIEKTGTRLKASIGTAYRAPSLYEFFDPSYGNPNLSPEESLSWDLGFEQDLLNGDFSFGVSYFQNKIDNYIGWDSSRPPWGGYGQIEGVKNRGLESFASYKLSKNLLLRLTHTYIGSENLSNGNEVTYIPKNKITSMLEWQASQKLSLNITGEYIGKRWVDAENNEELKDYLLLNFAANYRIDDKLRIFGRIENLLDQDYEEMKNYVTRGITFYLGLKYDF